MPTGGSKVQRRHCCAATKTQPIPPGCAIGTKGGCWGDGGCRNIEELVQKYNAVIAAQQQRRSQYLQDVQSAQEAAAGETVDVEI